MVPDYNDIKESAGEYLTNFENSLPELINELRAGNTMRIPVLADIMEGVSWTLNAMIALIAAGFIKKEEDIARDKDSLLDAMNEISNAVESQDYTLLADVLEYEILELAKTWNEILKNN